VIVQFRREALAQAVARRDWWIANRPAARDAFDDELASAVLDLAERAASIPVVSIRSGVPVRRLLMPTTRCHVYFAIDESRGVVEILALWGARMGRLPPLAKGRR
jgi:plasmid stabilization system protein ParE